MIPLFPSAPPPPYKILCTHSWDTEFYVKTLKKNANLVEDHLFK